ncbi:hypothetical protein Purlil1_12336 [Purpureocillium lilacinum]|uniref:Uncharacterized protein n=1 Tax=Purpureocillium lilacinum TaxID=33203 RepID=A0ABR0BH71_PURLI|nr:hypothetical protein Purlil1_12336 [Purpureocillium lilacinum]
MMSGYESALDSPPRSSMRRSTSPGVTPPSVADDSPDDANSLPLTVKTRHPTVAFSRRAQQLPSGERRTWIVTTSAHITGHIGNATRARSPAITPTAHAQLRLDLGDERIYVVICELFTAKPSKSTSAQRSKDSQRTIAGRPVPIARRRATRTAVRQEEAAPWVMAVGDCDSQPAVENSQTQVKAPRRAATLDTMGP